MLVTANQIRKSVNAKYTLWDGEMVVRVHQHTGVYGFHSAAIVVERLDSPLNVLNWNGYFRNEDNSKPSEQDMMEWIASQLTRLSTGTDNNEGGVGDVEGLLKAEQTA